MAFIRLSEVISAVFALTLIFSVYLLCAETPTLVPSIVSQPSLHYRHHRYPRPQHGFPGAASLRGRRPYQEDRLHCAPSIELPDRSAGLFGVFDGHIGEDASDFAARSIRERFLFHAFRRREAENTSFALEMEDALRNAISDIDLAFREHAAANDIRAGSTASVALLTGEEIVIANVGDSKALLCSSCKGQNRISNRNAIALRTSRELRNMRRNGFQSSTHPAVRHGGYCVKELTSDHHPDRTDERIRIETSGGFVTFGSLPRVNGQLAVSRSIGDYHLKQFGVISEPEFSKWTHVPVYDKFVVLASDGIFEKMAPQDVCDALHAIDTQQDIAAVIERIIENENPVIALPLPGIELPQSEALQIGKVNKHSISVTSNDYMSVDACKSDHGSRTIEQWKSYSSSIPELHDESQIAQVMAEILVELAFRAGSMDNLSAIVIPLESEPE